VQICSDEIAARHISNISSRLRRSIFITVIKSQPAKQNERKEKGNLFFAAWEKEKLVFFNV